ncbi:hypothetical protein DXG01_004332 [Tephrocybe rancida]|nr:hypothetical protein DXG01_004332 [Tephrocybe rancida]
MKRKLDSEAAYFLDLEADVDDEDDDTTTLDGEQDGFLTDDDSQPSATDRSASHRLLGQEHQRASADAEWEGLLQRARGRNTHLRTVDLASHGDTFDTVDTITITLNQKTPLWRVAVKDISLVEPQDAPYWLKSPDSYVPREDSWVRLSNALYRGDLAYVKSVNDRQGIEAVVVPRITLQRSNKNANHSAKRTRRGRPETALFDAEMARDSPMDKSIQALGAQKLTIGDNVKVVGGELQGAVGVIEKITEEHAEIRSWPDGLHPTIPITMLRKDFRVGDEVIVDFGPHAGLTAWVVFIQDELLWLYDHKAAREYQVASVCVSFLLAAFIIDARPYYEFPHYLNTELGDDPNRRLVGRHVRVIGKNRLKDYSGIVKTAEAENFLSVEIQATMKVERIHVSNLTHLYDYDMKPLEIAPPAAATSQHAASSRTIIIPESSLPLVPSTPIPEGSSAALGPAWDPSARSPHSDSSFSEFTCQLAHTTVN